MVTWAGWFKSAKARGIPLRDFLNVDIQRDMDTLYDSGLPVYDRLQMDGELIRSSSDQIQRFSENHALMWARLFNKSDPGERYFRLDLRDPSDLVSFIEESNARPLEDYRLQLYEFVENKMAGNILSSPDKAIVEMTYGTQVPLTRGETTPFHAQTNDIGRLVFERLDTPLDLREASSRALHLIRCSRSEYQPGYYEFIVGPDMRVVFVGMNRYIH